MENFWTSILPDCMGRQSGAPNQPEVSILAAGLAVSDVRRRLRRVPR
jgi:hypothetical protein